ncbi:MAG: hypothetical protein U0172_02065 [Nitrospiraceae bacterium]
MSAFSRAVSAAVFGVALATSSFAVASEGHGKITITSPKDGEVLDGKSFELKYEQEKAGKANHAHVYLDGQYQKGFKGTFSNVPAGKHEIKVSAATDDHKALETEAVVHVEVK